MIIVTRDDNIIRILSHGIPALTYRDFTTLLRESHLPRITPKTIVSATLDYVEPYHCNNQYQDENNYPLKLILDSGFIIKISSVAAGNQSEAAKTAYHILKDSGFEINEVEFFRSHNPVHFKFMKSYV